MAHFSEIEWLKFASDPVPARRNTSMQQHLADRCSECSQLFSFWNRVAGIQLEEARYSPPEDAVRMAKAIFPAKPSWSWLREAATLARILFDSFNEPVPAEIRAGAAPGRQFLQEAKPFMIDVRLECEPGQNLVRPNGQVLNSDAPNQDVSGVEVFLLKGATLTTRTNANPFGEFDLDFADEDGLQLFVDIRGQQVVEIALPTPLANC